MARDEMATITEDRWDEDIWGVENPDGDGKEIPKLYFYFGQKVCIDVKGGKVVVLNVVTGSLGCGSCSR